MSLTKKLFFLLFIAGFSLPLYAAVDGGDPVSCGADKGPLFDKSEGDKKDEEEEEPDCE